MVSGGRVQFYLHEAGFGTPIPATRLSDGTIRFVALLATLLAPSPPPLICIDEPELGLHPDAVSLVSDLIVDASERTQLIVATHSDALVSALSHQPDAGRLRKSWDGNDAPSARLHQTGGLVEGLLAWGLVADGRVGRKSVKVAIYMEGDGQGKNSKDDLRRGMESFFDRDQGRMPRAEMALEAGLLWFAQRGVQGFPERASERRRWYRYVVGGLGSFGSVVAVVQQLIDDGCGRLDAERGIADYSRTKTRSSCRYHKRL